MFEERKYELQDDGTGKEALRLTLERYNIKTIGDIPDELLTEFTKAVLSESKRLRNAA